MPHRSDAELRHAVIGAAIAVHSAMGPGLLESAYHVCMAEELRALGIAFEREVVLPVRYRGVEVEKAFRIDLLVEQRLIVELKAVLEILPIHRAQLVTYLRLARIPYGLLLNFHTRRLVDGIVLLTNRGAGGRPHASRQRPTDGRHGAP